MFSDRPQLAVEILRDLMGVDLPATPLIQQEDRSFNTRPSDDLEADLVFTLGPPQQPAHAIIVEVQQDKSKDPRQLARYAAALWLFLCCDVTVLVICPSRSVADHYAKPVDTGLTGYRMQARVLGPDGIPVIVKSEQAAAHLELAAMSVMIHGRNRRVIEAFAAALAEAPDEHSPKYYEYAYSMSAPAIRDLLKEIMMSTTWPVYSPFAREHYGRGLEEGQAKGKAEGIATGVAKGRAEGMARGRAEEAARVVLLVLTARGIEIPDNALTEITTCPDVTQLEIWVARAATAQTVDDLFNEENE
ncbi:hypothetical protein [Nonomuraea sp. NPDC050643]|uniref:hypothetical protein n=1 Tax=Nonomuraea sp. NPDC050643 TaxID=3155660 RepID=UPI0033CC4856